MERVLAVDLLHLMAAEGSHGAQIAQQLDASEVWHAYRDQKHDLFLPAGATSQVKCPLKSPYTCDQTLAWERIRFCNRHHFSVLCVLHLKWLQWHWLFRCIHNTVQHALCLPSVMMCVLFLS